MLDSTEPLQTQDEEVVPTILKESLHGRESPPDAFDAGGDVPGEDELEGDGDARDSWEVRGIYLVRVHKKQRTTFCCPAFCRARA